VVNFTQLIEKLIKAIHLKHHQLLLLTIEQKFSEKKEKVYTEYRLYMNMTTEDYNRIFPENAKNPKVYKNKYVQYLLTKTYTKQEMFLYLKEIWDKYESGEMYERQEIAEREIRSRHNYRRGKGAGGRQGVLQDAPFGKELSGGVSGDEQHSGNGAVQGDTEEA